MTPPHSARNQDRLCISCSRPWTGRGLACTACRAPGRPQQPKRKRARRTEDNGPLLAWLAAAGLPAPVFEYRFHPVRRWRFDVAWPDRMVALEIEGGVFTGGRHTRGKGYSADMEKYNEAAARGWTVLRVRPDQLCTLRTLDLLRRTIGGGDE